MVCVFPISHDFGNGTFRPPSSNQRTLLYPNLTKTFFPDFHLFPNFSYFITFYSSHIPFLFFWRHRVVPCLLWTCETSCRFIRRMCELVLFSQTETIFKWIFSNNENPIRGKISKCIEFSVCVCSVYALYSSQGACSLFTVNVDRLPFNTDGLGFVCACVCVFVTNCNCK